MAKVFSKPAISISEQAKLLLKRGLSGITQKNLEGFIARIGYYRLRGYTFPYQDSDENFIKGNKWKNIYSDYVNDARLRSLIFEAISFIEITFRCEVSTKMAAAYGANWYEDANLFQNPRFLKINLSTLLKDWERSREPFKLHYQANYDTSKNPPSWMIFETSSFGSVSKYYESIKNNLDARNEIAQYFGFNKSSAKVFISWMQHLNLVRNICAHHSRLFSRSFIVKPMIPTNKPAKWVSSWQAQDRLYPSICIITYLLDICAPDYDFRKKLKRVIRKFRKGQLASMGFPKNWKKEPLFCHKI